MDTDWPQRNGMNTKWKHKFDINAVMLYFSVSGTTFLLVALVLREAYVILLSSHLSDKEDTGKLTEWKGNDPQPDALRLGRQVVLLRCVTDPFIHVHHIQTICLIAHFGTSTKRQHSGIMRGRMSTARKAGKKIEGIWESESTVLFVVNRRSQPAASTHAIAPVFEVATRIASSRKLGMFYLASIGSGAHWTVYLGALGCTRSRWPFASSEISSVVQG